MPRILLLATTTGYQTRAFGEAAESLGATLVFATDRCHMLEDPWRDGAIAIRFHDEDASVEAIVAAARTAPLDGLITVGDRPTVIAARVAERLGLPGHPPSAAAIARDKQKTRERLRDAGLAVPWFVPSRIDADARILASQVSFPCVIKPVSLSGSRGVMRADNPGQFAVAFNRLAALLRLPDVRAERNEASDRVLVEGFIPGAEFALEGLLDRGILQVLAIFDKPDPLDGPFFEETLYVTPPAIDAEVEQRIVDAVTRAASAIGLTHGPIHAECRVNEQGVFVLEVAARPIGGLCARSLRFVRAPDSASGSGVREIDPSSGSSSRFSAGSGFSRIAAPGTSCSLEELLLRHASGESPRAWSRAATASGVMMIPIPGRGVYRGVSGVDAARLIEGIDDVTITAKRDQVLVPLPEGASYLGFIFARGATSATVVAALRRAHACLRFAIEPELRVVQSANGTM